MGWVSGESSAGAAGFCGPSVCLGLFLFSGVCLCQGLQGVGVV
jgi:hypothetical protein